MTNVLMKSLKLDPLSSLYYIAPLCAFFIGIACCIFELNDLPLDRMQTTDFMAIMVVNAVVAFTLNVAVVLLISNTSALVLTLAGIIKVSTCYLHCTLRTTNRFSVHNLGYFTCGAFYPHFWIPCNSTSICWLWCRFARIKLT